MRRAGEIRVLFLPAAEGDLVDLFSYLVSNASARVSRAYVRRVIDACLALDRFPNRGVERDDLARGLRSLGFERRVTILYRVDNDVEIVRVLYGGRDLQTALADNDDGAPSA